MTHIGAMLITMNKRIFFTGGGTGGHVFPAIAIIKNLQKEGYDITWIGSKSGIEYKIIKNENIRFVSVPSGKLRRYFSVLNFIDLFKIAAGFLISFFVMLKERPDVLFSKGGYVTVPPVITASLLKIPTLTHESDMSPGLATRINSRFVNKVLLPYEETVKYFSESMKNKVVVTGNPVREDFYNTDRENGLKLMGFDKNKPVILVLGGSLGAKEINDLVGEAATVLLDRYNIYHQMGTGNFTQSKTEGYKTVPFISSGIADIIAAADIVISRSGAGAVWEMATVGSPSIYIPLKAGSRGDQALNAAYAEKANWAVILEDVTIQGLMNEITNIENSYDTMVSGMKVLKDKRSSVIIADLIKEMI